jgi:tetratricopeptide (TPR) repeat protein
VRDRSAEVWTFWVHASSAARFDADIRKLACDVGIPGCNDTKSDAFALVYSWLRDRRNGNWLIVLDNADDYGFLLEPPATLGSAEGRILHDVSEERRLDCVPVCDHGSTLITTRSRAAALKMVEQNCIVGVGPMEKEHALTLVKKKLGGLHNQEEVIGLVDELEFMPLAIVQAAAYIRQREPRCTVRQYLDKLRKNEKSKSSLLNRDEGDLRRDRAARNSIILTWEISFEQVRKIRHSAAGLLSLMSFFDRQAISENLLKRRTFNQTETSRSGAPEQNSRISQSNTDSEALSEGSEETSDAEDEEFEEDLAMLRDYSFVSITADATVFEMHRLVQFATQRWLKTDNSFEHWGLQFMRNLEDAFPSGHFESWEKCRALFPHAMMALQTKLFDEEAIVRQASLLLHSGLYASQTGAYMEAQKMTEKSLRDRQRVLGDEHPDTIRSKANLASTYSDQGRWDEAEKLQSEVLETSKRVLGDEHPSTIRSKANLASTYSGQGRWDEAEKLQSEVLETSKRVLGDEHPDTITSKANLASTYSAQGRWDEAEKLQSEVLETSKRVLGDEHPSTLTRKANLASTYWNQGRWDEAEKLESEVLETSKRVLGDEHPDTLTHKANLAHTMQARGRNALALCKMRQSAEGSLRVLGIAHPDSIDRSQILKAWTQELNEAGEDSNS